MTFLQVKRPKDKVSIVRPSEKEDFDLIILQSKQAADAGGLPEAKKMFNASDQPESLSLFYTIEDDNGQILAIVLMTFFHKDICIVCTFISKYCAKAKFIRLFKIFQSMLYDCDQVGFDFIFCYIENDFKEAARMVKLLGFKKNHSNVICNLPDPPVGYTVLRRPNFHKTEYKKDEGSVI